MTLALAVAILEVAKQTRSEKKMNISQPNNETEAAYLGFTIVDELIDTLVRKGILTAGDTREIFNTVFSRLDQSSSRSHERAAKFIADWMKFKE